MLNLSKVREGGENRRMRHLYNVWKKEQELHEKFKHEKFKPEVKFGGWTECFEITSLILRDFPKNNS